MKQGRDLPTKIIVQSAKLRRPIPKAIANRPSIFPWLVVFYNAFTDLVGDRGWEYGPITWTARRSWALDHGLDDLATRLMHKYVGALDVAFLKWKRDTAAKHNQSGGNGNPSAIQRTNRRTGEEG